MRTGPHAEAMTAAQTLIDAAETVHNPWAQSFALLNYGIACCDAELVRARNAMRRGLRIAQESGNRYNITHLANVLGRLEARHGDPLAALEYLTLAVRNYHDSGNVPRDAGAAGCPRRLSTPARTQRAPQRQSPATRPALSPRRGFLN
jgi:hypothetical protein